MSLGSASATQLIRVKIFNKFNGHCAYCGTEIGFSVFHIDHLQPKGVYHYHKTKRDFLKDPGLDSEENLMPACRSCNCSKNDKNLEEWRFYIKNRTTYLQGKSSEYRLLLKYNLIIEDQNKEVVFFFERQIQ